MLLRLLKNRCPGFLTLGAAFMAVACRSTPAGYVAAGAGDGFSPVLRQMEKGCALASGKGSFAATLSGAGIPDMQFEGVWEKNFSELRAEIVSPLGEPLAALTLRDVAGAGQVSFSGTPSSEMADVASFLEFVGARNLRLISCGLHLRGKLFTVSSATPMEGFPHNFLSVGEIEAHSRTVDSRSEVYVRRQGARTLVEARSHFEAGFFTRQEVATVFWEGQVDSGSVTPTRMRALLPGSSVMLTFSDFE